MQPLKKVLRCLAGILCAAFVLLTLVMPLVGILNLWNENDFSGPRPDHWLLGILGYALTIVAFCVFSGLVSFVFFRYARYGALRPGKAHPSSAK